MPVAAPRGLDRPERAVAGGTGAGGATEALMEVAEDGDGDSLAGEDQDGGDDGSLAGDGSVRPSVLSLGGQGQGQGQGQGRDGGEDTGSGSDREGQHALQKRRLR